MGTFDVLDFAGFFLLSSFFVVSVSLFSFRYFNFLHSREAFIRGYMYL